MSIKTGDGEHINTKKGCFKNYIVTAHKATAVTHSSTGYFVTKDDLNLVVLKCTRLEIYIFKSDTLQLIQEIPINARIVAMELFRIKREELDSLFMLTERNRFIVVQFDPETGNFVTRVNEDFYEFGGKAVEDGQIGIVDPDARAIVLHLYIGSLKVLPITNFGFGEAFNVRLPEACIKDLKFVTNDLHDNAHPSIALLYSDIKRKKFIKVYDILLDEKILKDAGWTSVNRVNNQAAEFIIPIHEYRGVLVISYANISFISYSQPVISLSVHNTIFRAYEYVSANLLLLSDQAGAMYLLAFELRDNKIVGMKYRYIGNASSASTIKYLTHNIFFAGSRHGDSCLFLVQGMYHICATMQDTTNSHDKAINQSVIEKLEIMPNLGPILDFTVMDLNRGGECQIATCSGAFSDGTLRIIRNGICVNDIQKIKLFGIKGIWSLKTSFKEKYTKILVITFPYETIFASYNDNWKLIDMNINGFDNKRRTLACGNLLGDYIVQVTTVNVLLTSIVDPTMNIKWYPKDKKHVRLASLNPTQILVVSGSKTCHLLTINDNNSLHLEWTIDMKSEISCVDISPFGNSNEAHFGVVGTWDMEILVIKLEIPFPPIFSLQLSSNFIPRSVLFATLDGVDFCLCGMGNGQIFTYEVNKRTGRLFVAKKVTLSTGPITLNKFQSQGITYVFASSVSPAVIYGEQKKLMYSNFNDVDVNYLTSFSTKEFPNDLALGRTDSLTISEIDSIQKLHIESITVNGQPRRICHQPETNSIAIIFESIDGTSGYIQIYDDHTFEKKASRIFSENEIGTSIMSTSVTNGTDDKKEAVFVIGTAIVLSNETEVSNGRILVFKLSNNNNELISIIEKKVKGAVFTLCSLRDKILSTINYAVCVFEWTKTDSSNSIGLELYCTTHGHIMSLYADVDGDHVLIGDLMRSMSVYLYKEEERQLLEISRDFNSKWMTSVKILDEDVFLGSDNGYNLFSLQENYGEQEDGRLRMVGNYHLGEFVNGIKNGSLVSKNQYLELCVRPPVIFCTVSGQIGLIFSLKEDVYNAVANIEATMRQVIAPFGDLCHKEFRTNQNRREDILPKNFIDGDLVEAFLNLSQEKMDEVAENLKMSVEQVNNLIEGLNKMH